MGEKHLNYKSVLSLKVLPRLIIVCLDIGFRSIALIFLIVLGIAWESLFCNHLQHTIFWMLKHSRFYFACRPTIRIHVEVKSDSHSLAA